MLLSTLILSFLYFMAFFFSCCIFLTSNPVYSAFSLIIVFILTALILIKLNIKFLGFILIILYAGAICILFLFIIFTLNLKEVQYVYSNFVYKFSIAAVFAKLTHFMYLVLNETSIVLLNTRSLFSIDQFIQFTSMPYSDIVLIGNLLYTHLAFLFYIIGLLLLIGMIAIVILTKPFLSKH